MGLVLKGSFLVGSDHRILKRDGFRVVVFGEPFLRGFLIGKTHEVVDVSDLLDDPVMAPRAKVSGLTLGEDGTF
jgi:hypothetical protein